MRPAATSGLALPRVTAPGWLAVGLLLLAAAGAGLAASMRVVDPDVPGALGGVTGAVWVTVVPAVLAAVLMLVNRLAGLALAAGVGVTGTARLVTDLFVLLQPESVARPELFFPLSGRAYPLHLAAGGAVLLIADLLMVAAGTIAARALSRAVRELGDRIVAGPTAGLVERERITGEIAGGPMAARSVPMLVVGFSAVAFIGFATAQLPYSGGFIEARLSVPGTDFGSLIAPFLVAIITVTALILAGALPRNLAVALLGGVAATAAVPSVIALAVGVTDAPVEVSWTVYGVLIGALVLVLAGLLTTARWSADPADSGSRVDDDSRPVDTEVHPADPRRPARWAGAVGLLSGVLLILGALLPVLLLDGQREPLSSNGYRTDDQVMLPLLLAGILLVVAAAAALIPVAGVGRFGRSAQLVGWLAAVWAIAAPVRLLESLGAAADEAQLLADGGQIDPQSVAHWGVGPGLWSAFLGVLLGMAAAVFAARSLIQEQDEDATVADDDSAGESRRWRWVTGGIGVLATLIAVSLPLYRTAGGPSSAMFSGNDVWGVWALVISVVVAVVAAAVTRYGEVAGGAVLAAAAVLAIRLIIPAGVTAEPGYRTRSGIPIGWAAVTVLVVGAGVMLVLAGRVRLADPPPPLNISTSRGGKPSGTKSKGRRR